MRLTKYFLVSVLALSTLCLHAKNVTTTVKQVTESVTLTDDVDYVISDANEPFGAMGSVNIENTEHAVVIIKMIRPSDVIKNVLKNHVFINGEQAVNGKNCQVRMFNRGAIILPYASNIKPLTCYTEENFGGEMCNNYTEGSSGGFMKTLTASTFNNKIQSFKLKRGYMVTFAVGQGGWGYSRCFIADMEDLVFSVMPAPFKGTISSYRLFKWWNASKAGIHDTRAAANAALRTTSCFDWGQGNSSLLPDVEWVPNHIYEDWPSAATCGGVDGSCHMKTNNEPGNSADDHPQDVATVLGNWRNLMRTGMRLCSESSHDGSMGHLKEFITEIDKRGWRCDILDLHCYWDAGSFNNLTWYSDNYGNGRPIWISEWVWGASWNRNGAFADGRQNDDATYNGTKPIIDILNNHSRVERYYYWNSEAWYTNIYRDDKLTKLGEYYASTETGLAYNAANEYIPKIVVSEPTSITGTLNKVKKTYKIEWNDPNGDMVAGIELQRKNPGGSAFKKIADITPKDQIDANGSTYTYTDTLTDAGLYVYRVMVSDFSKGKHYSEELPITISSASSVGDLGYGTLEIASTDEIITEFDARVDETGVEVTPAVFIGMVSNKNTANGFSNLVSSISKTQFKYRINPWTLNTPSVIDRTENADYLLLPFGIYNIDNEHQVLVEKIGTVKGDTLQVTFSNAFPEGTTPVIVVQNNSITKTAAPVVARAFDVTNTGFKVVLTRQEGITGSFSGQNINFIAALPGTYQIGEGKLLTVYLDNATPIGGSTAISVPLINDDASPINLVNPVIVGAPQTFNFAPTSCFRQGSLNTSSLSVGDKTYDTVTGIRVKRLHDESTTSTIKSAKSNGDYMGWFILSDDLDATGNEPNVFVPVGINSIQKEALTISVNDGMIHSSDSCVKVYNMNGKQMPLDTHIPAGVYIITSGVKTQKIIVR